MCLEIDPPDGTALPGVHVEPVRPEAAPPLDRERTDGVLLDDVPHRLTPSSRRLSSARGRRYLSTRPQGGGPPSTRTEEALQEQA